MAAFADLSPEERVGLGVAVVLHVGLAAALVMRGTEMPSYEPPERIDVSLATDISLESTAPDPSAEPAAAFAPNIADLPQPEVIEQPDVPAPVVEPVRQPVVESRPTPPQPRVTATPTPRATTARPRPRATATPTPAPRPTTRATSTPAPIPTPARTQAATGSRLGADFLEGASDADGRSGSPAATFGPTEQAALASAITRQLKPKWTAPSGVDVDQLVTVLAWELNRDGSLKSPPRLVSQSGITDSNRPQAALHAERAIRAVQLAAPFNLPDQYYDKWSRIREWRFDRRL